MAWVKPFASFKPGVGLAYAWEPVILRGGRPITRDQITVRDWLAESIQLRKGLTGAKPPRFFRWVMEALGYEEDDTVDDLYPGTGGFGTVLSQTRIPLRAALAPTEKRDDGPASHAPPTSPGDTASGIGPDLGR